MSTNIAPIAEEITAGQIGRAADRFSERCRVNASLLPKNTVQVVLEDEGDALAREMFEVFHARVERCAKMITRRVKVNRSLTHKQALDATARMKRVNVEVLKTAPKCDGEEVNLYFFDLSYDPTADELDREMEIRGLKPDFDALAAINAADPSFADERPNVTQWRNANGKACFAVFSHWRGERYVRVFRDDRGWYRHCRFAGVRK